MTKYCGSSVPNICCSVSSSHSFVVSFNSVLDNAGIRNTDILQQQTEWSCPLLRNVYFCYLPSQIKFSPAPQGIFLFLESGDVNWYCQRFGIFERSLKFHSLLEMESASCIIEYRIPILSIRFSLFPQHSWTMVSKCFLSVSVEFLIH